MRNILTLLEVDEQVTKKLYSLLQKNRLESPAQGISTLCKHCVSSSEHVRSETDRKQHGGRAYSNKRKRNEHRTVPPFLADA